MKDLKSTYNSSVVFVHFLPVEFYPPVINLLNLANDRGLKIRLYTTHNNKGRIPYFNKGVKIFRSNYPDQKYGVLRLMNYFLFNLVVIMGLLWRRPQCVMYFETLSSYPVYIYKKYFNKRVSVFTHCHEYFSAEWYSRSMKLIKFYHKRETRYLYSNSDWISHTNKDRVDLFCKDLASEGIKHCAIKIVPNYPPGSWCSVSGKVPLPFAGILNCVYVGSLSLSDTYIKEFCDWVVDQNGRVKFDIYSFNLHDDTRHYLQTINCENIRFFDRGIEYIEMPEMLVKYHVGILLYKALSLNFKYNAPNKLFEYMACGLDVWFPQEMLGCHEFITTQYTPKVISVDFKNLDSFDFDTAISKAGLPELPNKYYAEVALSDLIFALEKVTNA